MTMTEMNELFIKEFDYFFMPYTSGIVQNYGALVCLFSDKYNYNLFNGCNVSDEEILKVVKDIIFELVANGIPFKNGKDFILELHKFLKKFWSQINFEDHTFAFGPYGNTNLIMTVFSKPRNPKNESKALFQIQDQNAIRDFILNIVTHITDNYEEYQVFTIKEGGINNNNEHNVLLNSNKMKSILKDYAIAVNKNGYKK